MLCGCQSYVSVIMEEAVAALEERVQPFIEADENPFASTKFDDMQVCINF